jgi:hypothetical protein
MNIPPRKERRHLQTQLEDDDGFATIWIEETKRKT